MKNNHVSINTKKKIVVSLRDLITSYPGYSVGRHLSTALSDYGDLWDVPDKEVLFALDKYRAELDLGMESDKGYDNFVEKVIEDSKHLDIGIGDEEDPEEEF